MEEKEELKQCALFNEAPIEKSRFSILSCEQDKSGMVFENEQENSCVMMFDDNLQDLQTGESLKQKQIIAEFSEEAMRVTTTEAQDIFDDEIWNHSMCIQHQSLEE